MQLRQYWAIVRRRWLIVALVIGLVVLGGGALLLLTPRQYTAEVRLLLNREPTQRPIPADAPFVYDDYYRFLSAEFSLDDAVEAIKGNLFAQAVLTRLDAGGTTGWSDEQVSHALKPDRAHRVLTIETMATTREMALRLKAAVETTISRSPELIGPADGSKLQVRVVHSDALARSNLVRSLLIYAVQIVLGVLVGLGLAFLLDYLDDRVRDESDAQALGVPVLGRLPAAVARSR